jgi:hypothetical protein
MLAAFCVAGCLIAEARATSIPVSNSSFEIGQDLGGTGGDWHAFPDPATNSPASTWTASNGYTGPYVENRVGDHFPTTPDGGSYSLLLSNAGTIAQDLNYTAVAGQTITLSFYTGFDGTSGSPVLPAGSVMATVDIGGQSVSHTFDVSGFTSRTWNLESLPVTATTGGDVTISFAAVGGNPWLDGVSVNASVVPEPSSIVLCVGGAIGLLLTARRRRS